MIDIQVYGDRGLRVVFGDSIDERVNEEIRSFIYSLEKAKLEGVQEWIPTYTTVSIVYDPKIISYQKLQQNILELYQNSAAIDIPPANVVRIPVCYGGEFGPDLEYVARCNQLTEEKVVEIHSSAEYLIYMMGFSPGFPYLGGMPEKIATPRLDSPRVKIPAGSVGIAGSQTGIYPSESPGGWQLIGRTPLRLYDPDRNPPILLEPGDYIRFQPVSKTEFERMQREIKNGDYRLDIEAYQGG